MSQLQVCRCNTLTQRHAMSGTSPPRPMSQIVLRWWCFICGPPKPLSLPIGTQWVWRGLSVTLCGMPDVPVHHAENSWLEALHALQASSIDMSLAQPLIVVHVYNMNNWHWVLRLLLIAPTREYLCLKFDSMCHWPHIVGANQEELAVVHLIAERKGVEPQQRKKWSKIFDAFGAFAFAIAPLHSTFIRQIDGVSCHPACLLTLHCALSRRVVQGILQVPQDRL